MNKKLQLELDRQELATYYAFTILFGSATAVLFMINSFGWATATGICTIGFWKWWLKKKKEMETA